MNRRKLHVCSPSDFSDFSARDQGRNYRMTQCHDNRLSIIDGDELIVHLISVHRFTTQNHGGPISSGLWYGAAMILGGGRWIPVTKGCASGVLFLSIHGWSCPQNFGEFAVIMWLFSSFIYRTISLTENFVTPHPISPFLRRRIYFSVLWSENPSRALTHGKLVG